MSAAATSARAATRALPWRTPGPDTIPAVLRRGAYWRTVWRFVAWGPLIGGAPYVVFVITIPFAYVFGALPALLAGMLFAAWLHAGHQRWPTLRWRVAVGALCGLAPAAVALVPTVVMSGQPSLFWPIVIAIHGVPAAMLLAGLQRPPRERRTAPQFLGPHGGQAGQPPGPEGAQKTA